MFRISRVRTFDAVEDVRRALLEFRETHNANWPVERHGVRYPGSVRGRGGKSDPVRV